MYIGHLNTAHFISHVQRLREIFACPQDYINLLLLGGARITAMVIMLTQEIQSR